MEDISSEITSRAFEYWGAFGFVVVILGLVIWWLLQHNKSQRASFQSVIDDLTNERKYWADTAFTVLRETNEQSSNSLVQVTQAIQQTERLITALERAQ
jgi:hypothetical protein